MSAIPINVISRQEFDKLTPSTDGRNAESGAGYDTDMMRPYRWLRVTEPNDDPAKEMNYLYRCYE